ncbi:MAG TPA: hypothetical protein PKV92_09110, partial [Thermodesulfovibrio thiophilus]|nr:hypothetical protein [Thermodesulfovibrio thiophilus]
MEIVKEIQIQKVKNPFIVEKDEIIAIECKDNETLLDIRNKYFVPDIPCVVVRNGEIVPTEQLHLSYPVQGDTIILTSDLGGGGGRGKNVLRMVLQISLVVVGAVVGQAWLGGIAGSLGATIGATIGGVVGGLLVNTFLPPPKPKLSVHGLDYDTSNAYSWNPQPTQQAGIPIPKIYGTYKIESPNIIGAYVQNKVDGYQYLNILSCIGIGPYKRIYDFKLNDQPIGNYQGITVYTQRGNLNQGLNFNFVDTRTEYNLSIKLSQNQPYIYQTVGDNFDGIEVDITFPTGLYYPNDAGGLDLVIVDFRVEIRRLGDSHWTPISFQAANIFEKVSVLPHWSLGRQVQDFRGRWYWEECRRGSRNPYEHNEGDEEYIYGKGFCNWKWLSGRVQLATQVADFTSAVGSVAAVTRRYFKTKLLQKGTYEIKVTKLANLWLSSRKLGSTPFENVVYLHARGGTHPSLTAIADSTSTQYSNSMYLTAVREVYYDDFIYPRHALVAINARATDQLSGSIRLSCMVEGSMVRIYNPDTQTWTVD